MCDAIMLHWQGTNCEQTIAARIPLAARAQGQITTTVITKRRRVRGGQLVQAVDGIEPSSRQMSVRLP